MWYFLLLLPVLFTIVRQDYIKLYISAFLLAISLTEIASYLVWFEIVEPFKNATVQNPTPFMSHISYNPILAFAIYIVSHEIFFNKKLTNIYFSIYIFFAVTMTINMFITGGRAGQVVFFVILSIIIFQSLDKTRVKALLTIFIVIPLIFFISYQTSSLFNSRVNLAVYEVTNISNESSTSVGLRLNFASNSWQVMKENSIIGVGTGDFPTEYFKSNQINSPTLVSTSNPHNMYILVAVQLGLLGLVSMLSIFYYQFRLSFNSPSLFIRNVGFTLPAMFLVINVK